MSKTLHVLIHVLAVAAQIATVSSGLVPTPYQPVLVAAIALAQAVVAVYNHGGKSGSAS